MSQGNKLKSNIYSILVLLIGISISYLISIKLDQEENALQRKTLLVESKSMSANIQNSIDDHLKSIQLMTNRWHSITQINEQWQNDLQALMDTFPAIGAIKLMPIVDSKLFRIPDQDLLLVDNEQQKYDQMTASHPLTNSITKVERKPVFTKRSSFLSENKIKMTLQFPLTIQDGLIGFIEVSLNVDKLLYDKLDTLQITKPFSIIENDMTLFSLLPKKLHTNYIREKSSIEIYGYKWQLMILSPISTHNKDLFLISASLLAFLLALIIKLVSLIIGLHKQAINNKSQLKAIEEEFRNSKAKLIQSNKLASLGEIAAGIAHEINQPLQVICIHADMSLDNLHNGHHHLVEKSIKAIVTQTDRIEKIVKQVGSFGRDSELDNYRSEQPNAIFNNVMSIIDNQYKHDHVQLRHVITPLLPSIFCNKTQIEQVLINLLINARDAVETSETKVVFFKAHAQKHHLYIQISDSGTGIDPDKINDIFTPFYTTKPLGKGTGLGLSISYSIIHQHKGEIKVSSKIGQGSVFTVTIPFDKPRLKRS
jgi:signal transduction histidine kinase